MVYYAVLCLCQNQFECILWDWEEFHISHEIQAQNRCYVFPSNISFSICICSTDDTASHLSLHFRLLWWIALSGFRWTSSHFAKTPFNRGLINISSHSTPLLFVFYITNVILQTSLSLSGYVYFYVSPAVSIYLCVVFFM